jgi:hypothetical protein
MQVGMGGIVPLPTLTVGYRAVPPPDFLASNQYAEVFVLENWHYAQQSHSLGKQEAPLVLRSAFF